MAQIVLVHGIAQEQESSDSLEAKWITDLAGGVRSAGFGSIADRIRVGRLLGGIDVRLAFFGELFLVPGQMTAEPEALKDSEAELASLLAREWLQRAAQRASDLEERVKAQQELAQLEGQCGEEQGIQAIARPMITSLAKVRWFAPFGMMVAQTFVNRALKQVTQYLTESSIREESITRVLSLISEDTIAVISHSLGSIVAFEAIHRLSTPLPLFMTLGSPLGLETIIYQRLRPQPPTYPVQAREWLNVYDPDDLIAAVPELKTQFSMNMPEYAHFKTLIIHNGAKPHECSRYLSKPEVGNAIAGLLNKLTN